MSKNSLQSKLVACSLLASCFVSFNYYVTIQLLQKHGTEQTSRTLSDKHGNLKTPHVNNYMMESTHFEMAENIVLKGFRDS